MSTGNRKRRRAAGLLPEPQKCVARKKDGSPCMKSPIKGAAVCRMHGGAAPQVQRKAAERIAHASDVAVMKLLALMQDPDVPKAVQAAVARDLLDRANVTGKTTIEVEVPLWQQILDGVVATVPTDGETAAMRPFAEGRDPLVIEAERVSDTERERELADELARYQAAPHDEDWSDDFAYGSESPRPAPVQEPATPMRNGADRPPPAHPVPERRRIEPDDPDYWQVPRTYTPTTPPPRRGRVAGRRR
nr:HGGxSTG domain-containing protein [Blastococcus saxobsidens]